jgi:hypothetical protein
MDRFKALLTICLIFAPSLCRAAGRDTLFEIGFEDPSETAGKTSVSAGPGMNINAADYAGGGPNVSGGTGSYRISFTNTGGGSAEWKLKFDGLPGIFTLNSVKFRVKGIIGTESFTAGIRGRSLLASTPVKLANTDWTEISIFSGKVPLESIDEFYISFSSRSPTGHIFLDDLLVTGKKRASAAPAAKQPAVAPAPARLKRQPPQPFSGGPVTVNSLIRSFDRSDSDLRAVSDMLLTASKNDPKDSSKMTDEQFMDLVQQRAFLFFWYECNPKNGITLDRGRCFEKTTHEVGSNASAGFMLTAVCIAESRGWITREQAYERVLATLKFHRDKTKNINGFFYHFVDLKGERAWNCEVSTIDTSLFLAGVVMCMEYFKGTEIEKVAEDIYLRVNWRWTHDSSVSSTAGGTFACMGWTPEAGFRNSDAWNRYCEGLLLTVLELGHPTANIDKAAWHNIRKSVGTYKGFTCVSETGPLFGYQYPHMWIDFRNKNDGWANHFEISVNETLANRQFAVSLSGKRGYYGPDCWGFTACDYPNGYNPFAAPPGPSGEDGTIAPTGPGGSFAFTPYLSLKALRHMYDTYRDRIWGKYGFVDAFNVEQGWFDKDNIGIDQGPILIAIENHRTGLVWKYFMRNKYIQSAFKKIGFVDDLRAAANALPADLSGGEWLLKTGDKGEWSGAGFDDSGWQKVYVPDFWENQLRKNYDGPGWYRKHFRITQETLDSWKNKRITLHIGGVDDEDETYLNGVKIGSASGWNVERVYGIDPKLLSAGADNVLAIRVKDAGEDGGIWIRPVEIGPFISYEFKPFK